MSIVLARQRMMRYALMLQVKHRLRERRYAVLSVVGVCLFVMVWWVSAVFSSPMVVPSPLATAESFLSLYEAGILVSSIIVSVLRILTGWALGSIFGVMLGLLLGISKYSRLLITPYVETLRYIPPIALIPIMLIWFGSGELSKFLLIFYTTAFVVILNTIAGVDGVKQSAILAARSLGATRKQVLVHVVVPMTVPFIITGLRLGLTNAFITIVAAEMIASNVGVGYLIWSSRNFLLTGEVFSMIIVIGLIGFVLDFVFHRISIGVFSRYDVT